MGVAGDVAEVVYVEMPVVDVEMLVVDVGALAAAAAVVVVAEAVEVGAVEVEVVVVQCVVSILCPYNVLFPEPFSTQVVPSLLDRVVPRNTVTPWTRQSLYSC